MHHLADQPSSPRRRCRELLVVSGLLSASVLAADPELGAPPPAVVTSQAEAGAAIVRKLPAMAPLQLVSRRSTGAWSREESPPRLDTLSYLRVTLDLDRRGAPPRLAEPLIGRSAAGLPIYEIPAESLAAIRPWLVDVLGGVIVHRFASLASVGAEDAWSRPPERALEPPDRAPEQLPEIRTTTGDFRLYTGIINQPVPDLGQLVQSLQVSAGNAAPEGATTISMEYRLLINDDPATPGGITCSDYEIYLSSDTHGGAVPHLLVYDNLGGATDGGFDDDAADDADIYLNYRATDDFDGEDPNQAWHVLVVDTSAGSTGKVEYVDLRIYWQQPDTDLEVTDVYFRSASGGGGVRIDQPMAGQQLYAHLEYSLTGPGFEGRIWALELDGHELCAFEGPVSEGTYLGSCVAPWAPTAGAHTLSGEVDPYHVVDELDENNNQLALQFTVPDPPDIRVEPTQLTLEREMPTPIYVELDYMAAPGHSHRPSDAVIDRIRRTFQSAGYAIHLDRGATAIAHQNVIQVIAAPSTSPDVLALMALHFDHMNDSRFFYSIWGHDHSLNGGPTGSSGVADLPGRVHLVTLGSFPNHGSDDERVGTFIHELGHNLDLRHGGPDSANCKPNFASVMNYYYQLTGIGAGMVGLGFAPPGFSWFDDFSYSHGLLASLDESGLDETLGLGLGHGIDWNGVGGIETAPVMVDVQNGLPGNACLSNGSLTTLHDFDDWSHIEPNILNRVHPRQPDFPELCISLDQYLPLKRRIAELRARGLIPPAGRGDRGRPGGLRQRLKSAVDVVTVHNDSTEQDLDVTSISLDTATGWLDWIPRTAFSVPPGEARPVQIFADLWQAPPGHTERTLTLSSNDPDEPRVAITLGIDGLGTCTVTTTATSGGGTTAGDVEAACGTFVTARAFPEAGFAFVSWRENGADASRQASYTWMLESDRTLDAVFLPAVVFRDGFESGDTSAWSFP